MVLQRTAVLVVLAAAAAGCGSSDPDPEQGAGPSGSAAATGSPTGPADPALGIDGVVVVEYAGGLHVEAPRRVAYDRSPPFGGPHDAVWAACDGVVYDRPVRNENMVHSLEHGAVWIAYDPDRVTGAALTTLRDAVRGQQYLMLSPHPGLDRPVSVQSWGHQLKVDSAADPRITAFVRALRANPATHPEPGATCAPIPGAFDPAEPPPFDQNPPGPEAVPMG